MEVIGTPEIVFDYKRDSCEPLDLPDVPAYFARLTSTHEVLLFSGDAPRYFISRGPTVDSTRRDCARPALISADSASPQSYRNWEWITSVRVVADTIYALVHNEYHDSGGRGCIPAVHSPANPCWYNSITAAFSVDGGRSFVRFAGRSSVVAAPPISWSSVEAASTGTPKPYGYFMPSNIVRGRDGFFYALFMSISLQSRGVCLIRTQTLDHPDSWRAWDGRSFTVRLAGPDSLGNSRADCSYVGRDSIADLHGSISFSREHNSYVLVGPWIDGGTKGKLVCGIFYALSADLIVWSRPRPLIVGALPYPQCGGKLQGTRTRASLVDPTDMGANFDEVGANAFLYFVNNFGGLRRDLMRVHVSIR